MSNPIISVENLGKRYSLDHRTGGRPERYRRLSEELADAARAPFRSVAAFWRRNGGSASQVTQATEDFWALREVSFEVKEGEVLGIIGRNGAGKSTLLKILSRITEPSEGRVALRGRVASLLEVGTGFHPELTGRENIYLNGAILGMKRAEISRKFDEITAFAEIERFLDTPVKRYSSGMYVRLAFAVAAHLDPEILLVDEVLAVGDADFQRKCLGKMQSVSAGGRTVLFVSHNMAALQNLCQRGVLLGSGKVVLSGSMTDVTRHYLREAHASAEISLADRPDRQGTGAVRFAGVAFKDHLNQPAHAFSSGAPAMLELTLSNKEQRRLRTVRVAVGIDTSEGVRVVILSTHLAHEDLVLGEGVHLVRIHVPRLALAPGRYAFTLYASVAGETADWVVNAGGFDVGSGDFYGSGQVPAGAGQGVMLMDHEFELVSLAATQ